MMGAGPVSFGEAFAVWLRIGLLGFGGPAGQIALMHRVLVDEKRWIDEPRFLHALNYCMLLPGPEAQQLATYVGWMLHRTAGGLAAGILFVLPGALLMLGLSALYAGFHAVPLVAAVFFGIKAAVLAIVVEALLRIARRILKNPVLWALAAAAFAALFLFDLPFPLVVLAAGAIGFLGARSAPDIFVPKAKESAAVIASTARPSVWSSLATLGLCLLLWFGPIAALAMIFGGASSFVAIGLFFSKLAVVTFGGAYAVLAYMAQQAVETHGWLMAGEMVDGLGLAETTPGPLILVTQFVGFIGAFRHPEGLNPWTAGILGAGLTTWVTFVPCFLWIFLGAPYVERLRGNKALAGALSAITAAVVGVILNLALWFGLHVLFAEVETVSAGPLRLLLPQPASLDPAALGLAALALLTLFAFRLGMPATLAICAAAGVGLKSL